MTETKTLSPADLKEREKKDAERFALMRQRVQETGKLDPNVQIQLDGKGYTLYFTNKSVKDILSDTGLNLLKEMITSADMGDPLVLGSLVFRGLQKKHPELTQEAVDEMLTVRHTLYVQAQVVLALSLFYPDVADIPLLDDTRPEAGSEDPTKKPSGNGSATGPSAGGSGSATASFGIAVVPESLSSIESSTLSGHSGGTTSPPN